MREITTRADKYLLEHFYQTCTEKSRASRDCRGVEICDNYSWIDVILDGERTCRECEFVTERQGFYYGKGKFSKGFEEQKYVTVKKIRSQDEFLAVCRRVSPAVRGMVIMGSVDDASPLEQFSDLEFVAFEGQKITRFWNTAKTPNLKMLTLWINKHLKSLSGLETAGALECLQFYGSFSDVSVHKIESLEPIAGLSRLREIVLSATEPLDHNIDHLIALDSLEYLWISPNLFPMECYARFEAQKFKLSDEYGIYCEESDQSYPYGKGRRVMSTPAAKEKYLREYNLILEKYKIK